MDGWRIDMCLYVIYIYNLITNVMVDYSIYFFLCVLIIFLCAAAKQENTDVFVSLVLFVLLLACS